MGSSAEVPRIFEQENLAAGASMVPQRESNRANLKEVESKWTRVSLEKIFSFMESHITLMCRYLATVRNKTVIDSERVQGHYLPVISIVLGEGGRDDLGARIF